MRRFIILVGLLVVAGCAGTQGEPDSVRRLLISKYVGKPLEFVVLDLGSPFSTFEFTSGVKSYTWQRTSTKYATNVAIKSDERCVITMLTDKTGSKIDTVGTVDDSLGAWQFSYCKEQYNL